LFPGDSPLSDEELAALAELQSDEDGLPPLVEPPIEFPNSRPASDPDEFAPAHLDYQRLISEGVPEVPHLERPYLPAGCSILWVGPAGSAKSIRALWGSCRLSRSGTRVVYISQENPLGVELRRLERLAPNPDHLIVYHYQGLDLTLRDHVGWLQRVGVGAGLIVLDTFTACWSGDENSNEEVAGFDRRVIRPVIAATGASVLTLDHTGHPTAFVPRTGVSAARGASSKGQKADLVLEFRDLGDHRFLIRQGKNRLTGTIEPDRTFEVIDTDENGLDIVEIANPEDVLVQQMAEDMAAFILAAEEPVGTNRLRKAAGGGKETQTRAMERLRTETPRRVVNVTGYVETEGKGRRRAKVWQPAPPEIEEEE
jgi:hypothetical protein